MKEKIIKALSLAVYWSLVLIPFSIAIAPAFTSFFIGLLFFSFFVKKVFKKEKFFAKTPIDLPFFILVVISIISIINSIDYIASMRGILKLVQYAFIYLIFVEELKGRLHIKRIILALLLGGFLASFDAIWQIVFGWDFIRGHLPIINIGLKRATAGFPNANVLGIYLTPIAPVASGFALYYLKKGKKLSMFVIAGLIAVSIILTFSRPAGLAFYLSLLFLGIFKKDKKIISILLTLLLILPFIAPKNIKDWAQYVDYNPIVFMCNYDRISIYRNTLNMIKHNPVLGVGISTFDKNYYKYKLPEPEGAKTGMSMYAHNNFLHMAGEIGLVGLAVFLWLLYRLFSYCHYLYKNLEDKFTKLLSLCLTTSLIAFLINGLTETNLYYSRVAILFWYIIGFILSLKKFLILQNEHK